MRQGWFLDTDREVVYRFLPNKFTSTDKKLLDVWRAEKRCLVTLNLKFGQFLTKNKKKIE